MSLWHLNSITLEFVLGHKRFYDRSQNAWKYEKAARQTHSQHAFGFFIQSHMIYYPDIKLTGIPGHAQGKRSAWPQTAHTKGNHLNDKAAPIPLGCEETTTQPFFKWLTSKSMETFSPRTLELRSMSPVGRRRTGLESWDGTAALQHCKLDGEEEEKIWQKRRVRKNVM